MTKGKILVVDDSALVRKLSEIALQEAGYEVHSAENGEEGLKKAESLLPDLILINFIMPKMTGLQFCEQIKEIEGLSKIPLILITSKGENVIKSFLEKSLVVDYLQKPFKSEDLVEKVEKVLSKFSVDRDYPSVEESSKISIDEVQDTEQEQTITPTEEIPINLGEPIKLELESLSSEEITHDREEEVLRMDTSQIELSDFAEEDTLKSKIEEAEREQPQELEITEKGQIWEESEKIDIKFEEPQLEEDISIPLDQEISHDKLEKLDKEIAPDFEESEIYSEGIEESQRISETIPEVEEREIYGRDSESLEILLDRKLKNFAEEVTSRVVSSFEIALKKHQISKNLNVVLSGVIKGDLTLERVLRFVVDSGVDGVLTFFSPRSSYELMILNRRILYCLGESANRVLGGRVLTELTEEERKDLTLKYFSELIKSPLEYFIFEEKIFSPELSSKFSGYELDSIIQSAY